MSEGVKLTIKKWTKEELEKHLKTNCNYSSAVVIAALYKKIYGSFPKIGLSGFQGQAAEQILKVMP